MNHVFGSMHSRIFILLNIYLRDDEFVYGLLIVMPVRFVCLNFAGLSCLTYHLVVLMYWSTESSIFLAVNLKMFVIT